LQLYLRVFWRFRALLVVGLVAAIALSVLSYASVHFRHGSLQLTPRKAIVWTAEARVLITTAGFPWGTAAQEYTPTQGGPSAVGDPTRLANLGMLYAELAGSDTVRHLAIGHRKLTGKVTSQVEFTPTGAVLPVVDISSQTNSAPDAILLANRAVSAFQSWVSHQEQTADISPKSRVVVQVLTRPDKPTILVPRKKTLPIVVFLAVMLAFLGMTLVLENLRPNLRTIAARRNRPWATPAGPVAPLP
jgi:hypothetical protein